MTFIVILIALLIERFFDWSHLRKWNWYNTYQRAIVRQLPGQPPFIVLAAIIIPLLLAVLCTEFILQGLLYGAIKFLFVLFIFIYCLGPQNLWADTFACINALSQGDAHLASEKLKMAFGVTDETSLQAVHRRFFKHIFIEANRRVFAIIFWFVVLGPIGAVLYRAVTLSSSESTLKNVAPDASRSASAFEAALDWVPVRIFTFILGLGGHFAKVFSFWSKKALLGVESNDILLSECGAASISMSEKIEIAEDGSAEKHAISLLDKTFVIALAVILVLGFII